MSDYLSSPIRQMMYQNMLANLSNGIISPLDKDIMAFTSLPDSVIDPYIKRETDPLQMMNLTNNALQIWVEESKKASYFTKHFVTLSRMIMNGVATMARGLVTLHMRGEDLDQAPLSIQELISISSCQFRKSYLGVLQTVKSHPEISARLLENQLSWNNTLLKLFKTKEKLAKPIFPAEICEAEAKNQISDGGDQNIPELTQASALTAQTAELPKPSGLEIQEEGLSGFSALSEPAAYGAVHAYGPISGEQKKQRKQAKLPKASAAVTSLPEAAQPEQPAPADGNGASEPEKLPTPAETGNPVPEEETAREIKAETNEADPSADGNEASGSEKLPTPADGRNTGSEVENKEIKSETNEPDPPAPVSRTSDQNTFFSPDDPFDSAFSEDHPPEPDWPP